MKWIAHRCGTDRYPELTVHAARFSLSNGAAYAELDTRKTQDGAVVVNHDDHAGRLFGVQKPIASMTAREFLSLRHKSDAAYPSYSLEQFLQAGIRNLLLHIKEPACLPEVLSLCERYGALNEAEFGVERPEDVRSIKNIHPVRVLGFIPQPGDIGTFARAGADDIRLWEQWIAGEEETWFRRVHAVHCGVYVMAMQKGRACGDTDPENIERWRVLGADGILIDKILPHARI